MNCSHYILVVTLGPDTYAKANACFQGRAFTSALFPLGQTTSCPPQHSPKEKKHQKTHQRMGLDFKGEQSHYDSWFPRVMAATTLSHPPPPVHSPCLAMPQAWLRLSWAPLLWDSDSLSALHGKWAALTTSSFCSWHPLPFCLSAPFQCPK